jgi:hypothetical protein
MPPKKKAPKDAKKKDAGPKAPIGRPRKNLGTRVSDLPLVSTLKPTSRRVNIDSLAMNRARLAYKRDYGKTLDERQSRALIDAMSTTKRGPIGTDVVGTFKRASDATTTPGYTEHEGFINYYKQALKAAKKNPGQVVTMKRKKDGSYEFEIPGIPGLSGSLDTTTVPAPSASDAASTAELRRAADELLAKNAKLTDLINSNTLSPNALVEARKKLKSNTANLDSVAKGIATSVSPMDDRDLLAQERGRERLRALDQSLSQDQRDAAAARVRQITRQLTNFDRAQPTRTINAAEADIIQAGLDAKTISIARANLRKTAPADGEPEGSDAPVLRLRRPKPGPEQPAVSADEIAATRAALRAAPEVVRAMEEEAPEVPLKKKPRGQPRGPPMGRNEIEEQRQRLLSKAADRIAREEEASRLARERPDQERAAPAGPVTQSDLAAYITDPDVLSMASNYLRSKTGPSPAFGPSPSGRRFPIEQINEAVAQRELDAARNALYQRDLAERNRRQQRRPQNTPQSVVLSPPADAVNTQADEDAADRAEYARHLLAAERAQEQAARQADQERKDRYYRSMYANQIAAAQRGTLDEFQDLTMPAEPEVSRGNIAEQARIEAARRAQNIVDQLNREREEALVGVRIPFGNPVRSNETELDLRAIRAERDAPVFGPEPDPVPAALRRRVIPPPYNEPVSDLDIDAFYNEAPVEPISDRELYRIRRTRTDEYNELLKRMRATKDAALLARAEDLARARAERDAQLDLRAVQAARNDRVAQARADEAISRAAAAEAMSRPNTPLDLRAIRAERDANAADDAARTLQAALRRFTDRSHVANDRVAQAMADEAISRAAAAEARSRPDTQLDLRAIRAERDAPVFGPDRDPVPASLRRRAVQPLYDGPDPVPAALRRRAVPIAFSEQQLKKSEATRKGNATKAENAVVKEMERKAEAAKGTPKIIDALKLQEQRSRLKTVTKVANDIVQDIISSAADKGEENMAERIAKHLATINQAQRGDSEDWSDDEPSQAFVNQPVFIPGVSTSSGPNYEANMYLSLPPDQQQAALDAMTEDQKLQLGIGLSMLGRGLSGGRMNDNRTDWGVLMDAMKSIRTGRGKKLRGKGYFDGFKSLTYNIQGTPDDNKKDLAAAKAAYAAKGGRRRSGGSIVLSGVPTPMTGGSDWTLQAVTFPDTDWKSSSSLRWLRSSGIKPMKKADKQGTLFRYRIEDPKKFTDYYTSDLMSRGRKIHLVYGK